EDDGRRTVPRSEELAPISELRRTHRARAAPESRDVRQQCTKRRLERPARLNEQLDRLVERGGIGAARGDEGAGRLQASSGSRPRSVAGPAPDRLSVAPHGVDLTVVGQKPE